MNKPVVKTRHFQCKIKELLLLLCYLLFLFIAIVNLPKSIWIYYASRTTLIGIGVIGIWRYSWWSIHVVRSLIYGCIIFPRRRLEANKLWDTCVRPRKLYIMMVTYNEVKETTEKVLNSILCECIDINIPTQLFVGTGSDFDENIIENYIKNNNIKNNNIAIPLEIIFVRQKLQGKRYAIGATLRAIIRNGLEQDDPVVFMDGDTYFMPGCLRKCLPFFFLYPKMQALTTYEQAVILNGPTWMKKWLAMRFAQRDFTMQSYSLSNKIITLTGRMSIFRGKHLLEPGFIDVIENDHLTHWLWGRFRFLSGDDKSTWYYLLKEGADMFYIPDATTITIENITGNPLNRMIENLRRWSGNTLRNGARGIALGPRRVGFYIWWCLIDQRISIWTMLVGHMIILMYTVIKTFAFLLVALIWIAFSRMCTSLVLFYSARRIEMSFPFLLYFNQLISALIKVYLIFRLPQQKWKNRGDQRLGFEDHNSFNIKGWVANYLTTFYCVSFFLFVLLYLGVVYMPTIADIITLW